MPPAARVDDHHVCPKVEPGPTPHVGGPVLAPCCATVLINQKNAARVSDKARCEAGPPDVIARGEPTVLIANKHAARRGDPTQHGGKIVVGSANVLIGKDPPQVKCYESAAQTGAPFIKMG